MNVIVIVTIQRSEGPEELWYETEITVSVPENATLEELNQAIEGAVTSALPLAESPKFADLDLAEIPVTQYTILGIFGYN